MHLLAKYGVAFSFEAPIIKRAVADFAVSADWTPATGDVKVSKDGGSVANITTLPVAVGGTGSAIWTYALSATEMQAKRVTIQVVDSATKAVEDQSFVIQTYGHASAQHAVDLTDSVRAGLTALPNAAADAAGGLPISDAGGLDLDAKLVDGDLNGYFGAIWYKGTGGTAGSTFRVHGKHNTPTTLPASVVTLIAASLLKQVNLVAGATTYTLASTYGAITFAGEGAPVALGSQDISSTRFAGCGITGIGTGTGPSFSGCSFGASTVPAGTRASSCVLAGTMALGASGSYDFDDMTTETGATAIINGAAAVATLGMRRFAGVAAINALGSGSVVNISGSGVLTLGTGQSGVTVNVYSAMTIINNGSAVVNDLSNSAAAVWQAQIADYSGVSGSTAEQLSVAGAAGDPWDTALPGSYADGKAGKIIGQFLDAAITSRLGAGDYTAPSNASIATILAAIAVAEPTETIDWSDVKLGDIVSLLGMLARNKKLQGKLPGGGFTVRNAADSADVLEGTVSDDGDTTTFSALATAS